MVFGISEVVFGILEIVFNILEVVVGIIDAILKKEIIFYVPYIIPNLDNQRPLNCQSFSQISFN